jgi:hypothetical protein
MEQNFRKFKDDLIKAGTNPGPELIDMILAFLPHKFPYIVYGRDEIVETSRSTLQAAWKEVNDTGSVSVLESSQKEICHHYQLAANRIWKIWTNNPSSNF